jgi:hypothetical protein
MYSKKYIYENIYLSVFYGFSKFDGSKKVKVWHSYCYHPKIKLPCKIYWILNNFIVRIAVTHENSIFCENKILVLDLS